MDIFFSFFLCVSVVLRCESKTTRSGDPRPLQPSERALQYVQQGRGLAPSGNSRLGAWKRTKDRCYFRSRSHTPDMRWHVGSSPARPCFSSAVVVCDSRQQRLIVLDVARQRMYAGIHLSALFQLEQLYIYIYFFPPSSITGLALAIGLIEV